MVSDKRIDVILHRKWNGEEWLYDGNFFGNLSEKELTKFSSNNELETLVNLAKKFGFKLTKD